MLDFLRRRRASSGLHKANQKVLFEVLAAEDDANGGWGETCPARAVMVATTMLASEAQIPGDSPFRDLTTEQTVRVIRCLGWWLDAVCEGALTGDEDAALAHADRFIPLSSPIEAQFRSGQIVEMDECFFRLVGVSSDDPRIGDQERELMRATGGGWAPIWRVAVAGPLESFIDHHGRWRPDSTIQCTRHPAVV